MAGMLKKFKEKWIKPTPIYKRYRVWKAKPLRSNGGWGEDILLHRLFTKRGAAWGTFVDAGCNHPIIGNVTYALYQAGWRGLNIDITQGNIDLCNMFRPQDKNLRCGVSARAGELTAYIFDPGSGLNTLNKDHALEWSGRIGKPFREEKVPVRTLDDVIGAELPDRSIDLITIDVERHDLEALRGLDLDKHRPKVVMVEVLIDTMADLISSGVYKHLLERGYVCIAQYRATGFFARADWDYKV